MVTRRLRPRHPDLRSVHVNSYPRYRYGRWESVCEHWRSPPGMQLVFEF